MGEAEIQTAPPVPDRVGRQKERSEARKTYKEKFHLAFVSRNIGSPSAMDKAGQRPIIETEGKDSLIQLPEALQFLSHEAIRVAFTLHEVAIRVEWPNQDSSAIPKSTTYFFDLNKFVYYQTDRPLFSTINTGGPIDRADLGQASKLTPNIMQGLTSLLQSVNTRKDARIIIPRLQD